MTLLGLENVDLSVHCRGCPLERRRELICHQKRPTYLSAPELEQGPFLSGLIPFTFKFLPA